MTDKNVCPTNPSRKNGESELTRRTRASRLAEGWPGGQAMKLHRLLPLVVLLGSVALAVSAQVCTPDAPLRRTLAVNVLDQQGNLVRGLTAADFRGEFRGRPLKLVSAKLDSKPRRIVILLDVSGRMRMPPRRRDLTLSAVGDIAAHFPLQTQVALLLFAEKSVEKVDFKEDRAAVRTKLATIRAAWTQPPDEVSGRTALGNALHEAVGLLAPVELGDALYVVSDGGQRGSQTHYGDAEQALYAGGIRLFAFVIMDAIAARKVPELAWGSARLKDTAEDTGGGRVMLEVYPDLQAEWQALAAPVRALYQQMAEFYRVEAELPVGVDKARDWKLEVVDSKAKRRKDVEVTYPRKLVPCTAAPTP